MAKGDVKAIRSNYRRGSYGGSSHTVYDDEGRGESLRLWEWFKAYFEEDPTLKHLLDIPESTCYTLVKHSTYRYGLMDITHTWEPGWRETADTRAHRLVVKELDENSWNVFFFHMMKCYDAVKARQEKEAHEQAEKWKGEWAAYEAQRDAERVRIARENTEKILPNVQMSVGALQADFSQTFGYAEGIAPQGDWIEETVDAYQGQDGFGYEKREAKGVKLDIKVALDLSNSMYYNGVHALAANTYRDLCMTLALLKSQYPEDLFVSFWQFSDGDDGKWVTQVGIDPQPDNILKGCPSNFLPSEMVDWMRYKGPFTGEDTWVSPLFEKFERWENTPGNSDPGAVRMDILLTDAVLEHPADIRKADAIQDRRDGSLYTVFANFMPREQWLNSTNPKRCFEVPVTTENVSAMLRQLLEEFVSVHIG